MINYIDMQNNKKTGVPYMKSAEKNLKHESLTTLLRQEIQEKSFTDNRFYTVKYIMNHYNVSQATSTRALQPLFNEGLLYSVPGKGTFIREKSSFTNEYKLKMVFCVVSDRAVFNREYNPRTWFAMQEIFAGVSAAMEKHGSNINLITIPVDGPEFRHLAKMPNSAFIFLEYDRFESQIEYCIKNSIPYAIYAKHHKLNRKIKQVWLDVEQAQYDAVSHLIARGHRNIAFVGDKKNSGRYKGYCNAIHDAGLSCRQDYIVFNESGDENISYEQAMILLKEYPEVTAFACSNDIRAVGVLKALQDSGKRTPNIAVSGIDDIGLIYHNVPETLTTVHLPFREIGEALVNMAYSNEKELCIRMSSSLVIRQTT